MTDKKYKLTENTKIVSGVILYQIVAATSFGHVSEGDLGGWIQSEKNLSQSGNAWVSGNASVSGNAWVSGDARVTRNAQVFGNAQVYGNAWVYGNAEVYGNAQVSGNARVYGNAKVSGYALVYGNAWVYGNAEVFGNAWVYGNARVYGNAELYVNAEVSHRNHIITISNLKHHITVTNKYIQVGCKTHTLDEYLKSVIDEAGDENGYTKEDKDLLRTLLPILDAEVKRQYELHPLPADAMMEARATIQGGAE